MVPKAPTQADLDAIDAFIGIPEVASDGTVPEALPVAFQRILVAHDGSERADIALGWAILLADRFGGALDVAAVVAPPPYLYDAGLSSDAEIGSVRTYRHISEQEEIAARSVVDRAGAQALDALGDDSRITTHVIHGAPAYVLTELARDIGADLIAMGSHGHTRLERFLLGSVTDSVTDRSPCSVLISRNAAAEALGCVLATSDGSQIARRAVATAAQVAAKTKATLEVVHVIDVPHLEHPQHGASYYRDIMEFGAERSKEAHDMAFKGDVRLHIATGRPGTAICDHVKQCDAKLAVVGSHGSGRFVRAVLGSVARRVAHDATCSVLIIKEPRKD